MIIYLIYGSLYKELKHKQRVEFYVLYVFYSLYIEAEMGKIIHNSKYIYDKLVWYNTLQMAHHINTHIIAQRSRFRLVI